LRNETTESALFHWHVWICTEIARATVILFSNLVEAGPIGIEAEMGLDSCVKTFEQLCKIGESLGKES
jgi:hypothetical protein